ncbi:MAG: hypothetical protein BWK80_22565 [Desulfobacteraceae bacterium IS3]|nr:MAG: hypothetical protein BWK80_22565 [Desulfobacteraceae bacterium IS3]HAO19884.1 hypothetical protein [Desulfobacteraceae bacterium]
MKRFFLSIVVFVFMAGMAYSDEVRTWTDANGVKHVLTITREVQKSAESGNASEQSTAADQGNQALQNQPAKKQSAPEKTKTEKQENQKPLPQGVNPNGSFQFDIDSHKPKF